MGSRESKDSSSAANNAGWRQAVRKMITSRRHVHQIPTHYSLQEHLSMQLRSSKRHYSFRNSEQAVDMISRNEIEIIVKELVSACDTTKIAAAVGVSESVRSLSLDIEISQDFTRDTIKSVVSHLRQSISLEELRLRGAGTYGAIMVGELLADKSRLNGPPLRLCHLIGGEPFNRDSVTALSRGIRMNTNLNDLRLVYMQIDDELVHALAVEGLAYSSSLRKLDLGGNQITDEGLVALCQYGSRSQIESLSLRNNRLTDVSALLRWESLKDISLGRNMLKGNLETLSEMLGRGQLERLEIDSNQIGSESCAILVKGLSSKSCVLKELSLSLNPIGDAGFIAILEAMPPTLETLNVRSCRLTKKCVPVLTQALKRFPNLKHLCISENAFGEETLRAILPVAEHNLCLEQILMDGDLSGVSDAIIPLVKNHFRTHRSMRMLSLLNARLDESSIAQIQGLFAMLHSHRAQIMTALVAPLWLPRLHNKRLTMTEEECSGIHVLPLELIRLVCETLYG